MANPAKIVVEVELTVAELSMLIDDSFTADRADDLAGLVVLNALTDSPEGIDAQFKSVHRKIQDRRGPRGTLRQRLTRIIRQATGQET